ncbi:MAG: hypothetical protein V4560_11885 [Bacteroidota bacterium]
MIVVLPMNRLVKKIEKIGRDPKITTLNKAENGLLEILDKEKLAEVS